MRNIFKGSLRGHVCEDCLEAISNVEVLFYLPYRKEIPSTNAVSNVKETFHLVSKEEAGQREKLRIGRATTDKNGDFEFEVENQYIGADIDVDFICGTVPPKPPIPKRDGILQFHLTTLSMKYELEQQAQNPNYVWKYDIVYKWWCYIRGHFFDAWVICGHLMNCKTNTPIANANVTAMDADFLTDDNLGSAVTDANGHFRIDYSSADFKKTFLSPWINVETDPNFLSFQSGPDVYFKAELAGTKLVDETKADARKNVGYCLCVNLCSEVNVTPNGTDFPSAWTGIGNTFSSSFGTDSGDFDAEGYAGSAKHVLYSTIRLTGQAALKSTAGYPIEYRFSVSNTTFANDDVINIHPEGSFTKIVGLHPNLFAPGVVSKLIRKVFSLIHNQITVYSDLSDFDGQGWFDVNHAIERALINAGLTAADLALYNIIEEDTLISMNTAALTSAANIPDIFDPGQDIPEANKIGIEKFAIRFEIREVKNKPANQFGSISGGKILNSVIMNNNPIYRKLSIKELEESTLCTPIKGTIHAKYTLYHPYLSSCSLTIRKNSDPIDSQRFISDAIISTTDDERMSNGSQLNNPPALDRCTYIVKLYSSTRKHDGDYGDPNGGTPLEQLFFYDKIEI
ncbi:carboxypeptidase regulatory-like domain-containing protein [Flavobacterium sp. MC2016-06]|uniref:carboxypeptidase regulatory-like domain-containing protein n=1 Tax=Flavobacterium sp. MC2016-06 TaxID=2676308 RepID=UPI0012BA5A68|nr:carboxypeptidase regulatory-like domain-containing protein [Flavobacterium sp. MC2016-06]MBU3859872.1 carboxypeptidase regulatory-like domain-containing protein [Flavobacterium sp. MC2016-06]